MCNYFSQLFHLSAYEELSYLLLEKSVNNSFPTIPAHDQISDIYYYYLLFIFPKTSKLFVYSCQFLLFLFKTDSDSLDWYIYGWTLFFPSKKFAATSVLSLLILLWCLEQFEHICIHKKLMLISFLYPAFRSLQEPLCFCSEGCIISSLCLPVGKYKYATNPPI